MSGRAHRRLLKERDNESLLSAHLADCSISAEGARSASPSPTRGPNLSFSFLLDQEEEEENEENINEVEKPEVETNTVAKKRKQKNKKKKKSENPDVLDEFEQIVVENPGTIESVQITNTSNAATTSSRILLCQLWRVRAHLLDPELELRRRFGSSVVQNDRMHRDRKKMASVLAVPANGWAQFSTIGLGMKKVVDKDEYVFHHSTGYQKIHENFLSMIEFGDPSHLTPLFHAYPYYPDALIALSRVLDHGGEREKAGDLILRALYAYEKAGLSSFNWTGLNPSRLPYIYTENRGLHLAVLCRISFLERSACWATALEWAKLLISLDPLADPLGCYFFIDNLALRSRNAQWFLDLSRSVTDDRMQLLPNLDFSCALANYMLGNQQVAKEALESAATRHPYVVPFLVQCKDRVAPILNSNSRMTMSERLFVVRLQKTRWMDTEIASWAASVLSAWEPPRKHKQKALTSAMTESLHRHVIVTEVSSLYSALPNSVRHRMRLHDPLPPVEAPPSHYTSSEPQSRLRTVPIEISPFLAFLQSLAPWINDVQQLRGN